MRYYPVFLDISEKLCVVVGAGRVAERKAISLLRSGARVVVIGTRATTGLSALSRRRELTLVRRAYRSGDLDGALLVVAASSSRVLNSRVCREAEEMGLLVNAVDDPASCSFIVPSVLERGALVVAVSTSAQAPALARRVRVEIEERVGDEYAAFVDLLGEVRRKLLKSRMKRAKKENIIKELVGSPIPAWLASGSTDKVDALLARLLGPRCTLSALGIAAVPERQERPSRRGARADGRKER